MINVGYFIHESNPDDVSDVLHFHKSLMKFLTRMLPTAPMKDELVRIKFSTHQPAVGKRNAYLVSMMEPWI